MRLLICIVIFCLPLAVTRADVMLLDNGTVYPSVVVLSYGESDGLNFFEMRRTENGELVGAPIKVSIEEVRAIEFRHLGDNSARAEGRNATLTMDNGREVKDVPIESFSRLDDIAEFIVRKPGVPAGRETEKLEAGRIQAIQFDPLKSVVPGAQRIDSGAPKVEAPEPETEPETEAEEEAAQTNTTSNPKKRTVSFEVDVDPIQPTGGILLFVVSLLTASLAMICGEKFFGSGAPKFGKLLIAALLLSAANAAVFVVFTNLSIPALNLILPLLIVGYVSYIVFQNVLNTDEVVGFLITTVYFVVFASTGLVSMLYGF